MKCDASLHKHVLLMCYPFMMSSFGINIKQTQIKSIHLVLDSGWINNCA